MKTATIFEAQPREVPHLKELLAPILSGNPLVVAGLAGESPGLAVVDRLTAPTSCLVRMQFSGETHLSCTDQQFLIGALARARTRGDVRLLWEDPEVSSLSVPDGASEEWKNVIFTYRPMPEKPAPSLPEQCRLVPIDDELIKRRMWQDLRDLSNPPLEFHGSALGFALMRGDEILCAAGAPFWGGAMVHIGVVTPEKHRRQGYAYVACEHLMRECERMGSHPVWHTSAANRGSMALARKLGFRGERTCPGYLYPGL